MVQLVFDAAAATNPLVRLTFGRNRSEFKWTDRREILFSDLAVLLSRVTVGPKDGSCFTPATFSGFSRRMDQAQQIDVAVLDADCGHTLDEIATAIRERGWRAVIHSTHSHLSDTTLVSAGALERWKDANPGKTDADYMLAKEGYLPRVIESASIRDEVTIDDKRHFVISHAPCPKYRIVLPLESSWLASDSETQQLANARWRERIYALASALRLRHDQSCVDTSRLFYLPRRKSADHAFEYQSIEGALCPLWSLPDAPMGGFGADYGPLFSPPPGATGGGQAARPAVVRDGQWVPDSKRDHTIVTLGDRWIDLTEWAAKYAGRFEAVTALRARSMGQFSPRGVSGAKHHIYCPNKDSHVTDSSDGTGAYAINASQIRYANMPSLSGFQINCMHHGCANLDRLDHLAALLRCDALSISDLTDDAFLTADIPQVDPSSVIKSRARFDDAPAAEIADDDDSDDESEVEIAERAGNVPESIFAELPGVLGEMHEWIMCGAVKQQPEATLGACLALCATAIGQRVRLDVWDTRPNIYVLAVAHTGAGKDHPRKAVQKLTHHSGLYLDMVALEEVSGDSGIIAYIHKAPRGMLLLDEISALLDATKAAGSAQHVRQIPPLLLKLFSASNGLFQGKAYADTKRERIIIDQPCVSLYGSCTPQGLTDSLRMSDIQSGLLSRIVVFDAGDRDPPKQEPSRSDPPQAVVDWITAWNRINPIENAVARVGGAPVVSPRVVGMTPRALATAREFDSEMDAAKKRARARGTDSLYVRAHEYALKFALIRACAAVYPRREEGAPEIDLSTICVDEATMRWAILLARATVQHMEALSGQVADTPFQRQMTAILEFLQKREARGATPRELMRSRCGKMPKRALDDLLESISSAGHARWVVGMKTKTRTRDAWVHRDFVGAHTGKQK